MKLVNPSKQIVNLNRLRLQASLLSLGMGALILSLKFFAYHLTHSMAILSDALESVVNVVSAAFAVYAIRISQEPPDEEHPYGHGKYEFVTAVFEGGLITFAAFMIAYEALAALIKRSYGVHLEHGLAIISCAGLLNGFLGLYLLQTGKKTQSMALVADGKHILSDFYTSMGMIFALFIVKLTGQTWLDPIIALLMAMILGATGLPLIREAVNGLIDAADPKLLQSLLRSFEKNRTQGIVRAHYVRAMRNGRHVHIDGHLVVPEFWSVEKAHDLAENFSKLLIADAFPEGEIEFHIDPCRKRYCRICDLESCPIRVESFSGCRPHDLREIMNPFDITNQPTP